MFAQFGFGRRGKNRFRQFFRFLETSRQFDAADGAVFFIAFPAAAGDIAADDAFHGNHGQFLALHAVAVELGLLEKFRHVFHIDRNHMIGNDIFRKIEPEAGHLCQDGTFLGNLILEDMVKSRDAVRGYHDDAIANIIYFADFARFKRFIFFHAAPPSPNSK